MARIGQPIDLDTARLMESVPGVQHGEEELPADVLMMFRIVRVNAGTASTEVLVDPANTPAQTLELLSHIHDAACELMDHIRRDQGVDAGGN